MTVKLKIAPKDDGYIVVDENGTATKGKSTRHGTCITHCVMTVILVLSMFTVFLLIDYVKTEVEKRHH